MPGCGKCGAKLDIGIAAVGRRDTCPSCGADLHACVQCRHYDENVAKECKEPFAEVPGDKESGNFCDLFQIGEGMDRGGKASKSAALSAAEALFKK
ncbi:MAG: hypothetical protein INH41_21165 [Myxococcaceae bacterium]|jgi:hypothetical protein|nr:hypothetical protein [Myxococcaceae bacterium]MCA3014904.1 hypothetical protein [Myxococcaceae bacterium]